MRRLRELGLDPSNAIGRLVDLGVSFVARVAFWVGIAAPVAYLAMLAPGVRVQGRVGLFLTLVAVHCVALVLGHSHRASES